MMLVAAKSKILEKIGFWLRNSPLLGIRPGEKQSTFTLDLLAESRRCASSVKRTLHSFESLSKRDGGRGEGRGDRGELKGGGGGGGGGSSNHFVGLGWVGLESSCARASPAQAAGRKRRACGTRVKRHTHPRSWRQNHSALVRDSSCRGQKS